MTLISCQYCGVVIDTNRICEPNVWDDQTENYDIIEGNSVWIGGNLVPGIDCPCCRQKIAFSGKECY